MKKLLVLLVSAALVLSMAAVSMADVKVSGEVSAKYSFTKGSDSSEGKISFDSQVNDELSAKLVFKGASIDEVDGKSANWDVFIDEYNFIYKPGFVDVQVGLWGYKSKGNVDVIDFIFKDFKSEAAVLLTKNFDNGINVGLWYTTDESIKSEPVDDNAYVLNVGYTNDYVDLDAFIIDEAFSNSETSFSLTASLTMMESLTPYLSYGLDKVDGVADGEALIIGLKYVNGGLTARAEYDIEDDLGDDRWGIKANYTFGSGIYAEYAYATKDDSTTKDELKFGVKFK